jgi:hypothetical protein
MLKILVLSLSYKIFPILRFLHQQDFIAFNIAQVVTFCSREAAWNVISNQDLNFPKERCSVSTLIISPRKGRFLKSTLFDTASSAAP